MPLHWFEAGRKVNQDHYMEVMSDIVEPWIKETYGDKDIVYCFQQACSVNLLLLLDIGIALLEKI